MSASMKEGRILLPDKHPRLDRPLTNAELTRKVSTLEKELEDLRYEFNQLTLGLDRQKRVSKFSI